MITLPAVVPNATWPSMDGSLHFASNGNFGAPRKMFRRTFERGGKEVTSLRLEGVPVFRSGTFRDSWGEQTTWEQMHMAQMVANFNFLRNQQIFADVPVRKGHGSFLGDPMDSLIGYMDGMSNQDLVSKVDGVTYNYLLADYDILDPEAMDKIESGLWRNRSAEIGTFVTNNEAAYTPTFMGFAYVDIPAVEGLNGLFSKNRDFAVVKAPKEQTMAAKATPSTDTSKDDAVATPAAVTPPTITNTPVENQPTTPSVPAPAPAAAPDQTPAPVEQVAQGVEDAPPAIGAPTGADGSVVQPLFAPIPQPLSDEDEPDESEPLEVTDNAIGGPILGVTPEAPKADEPEEAAPLPVTEVPLGPAFAKWNGNHFTLGGKKVSPEYAANLINQYQAANVAAFSAEKASRVRALAKDGKIMAPSLKGHLEYAAGLKDRASFDAWIALEEARPALPLFGKHTGNPVKSDSTPDELQLQHYEAVVNRLRLGGKSESEIKRSESYQKGIELAGTLGKVFGK
jgi:hypothetical protein